MERKWQAWTRYMYTSNCVCMGFWGRVGMGADGVLCVMWVVDALASAVLTGRAQDHLDKL